jgi:hypothetical protein
VLWDGERDAYLKRVVDEYPVLYLENEVKVQGRL